MAFSSLEAPPVLSTPETHIFEDPTPTTFNPSEAALSPEEVYTRYEIKRTVQEIRQGKWRRIALQFPDDMLQDAPKVFEALSSGLKVARETEPSEPSDASDKVDQLAEEVQEVDISATRASAEASQESDEEKLFILADTSYGACCVDEVAAEHVNADVVVHYGRSCLSPTARLPVIYVFTRRELSIEHVLQAFKGTFPEKAQKVILMADVTYAHHITSIYELLNKDGYTSLYATSIIHDPSSPLPNRTIPKEVVDDHTLLQEYKLFHISDPPQSLLMTLSSRVSDVFIYPTNTPTSSPQALQASTSLALRRRYAIITKLSTVPIFGILINTLSVKNYIHIVDHVKERIAAAGKKSYTFVVGKVNAAKVANFSEIGGWVIIGCWESSLIESKDFWKPIITPYELELALKDDEERIWTGEWRGDFQGVLDEAQSQRATQQANGVSKEKGLQTGTEETAAHGEDPDSEPESAPPEFDLRTGRYVSHTRPMQYMQYASPSDGAIGNGSGGTSAPKSVNDARGPGASLVKRFAGDLATVGGQVSPGAEFLRSNRTWKGLGSDFEIAYDEEGSNDIQGAPVEEGRSGIARGYTVGDDAPKR
ncbi:putative diphthamide biosynthesis protein Dph2 [Xylona heveae TC161]|uniref:2-(3-amino-3-carboxypropyl)histidine synthase subunit 2 n=1 Tax=Xylona heveae (strain CBS 132557 / TC161) TaxID=1328760 RepID=A0A165JCZ6_XYLHT|nr:putative diphthamide biosynthesis protein Dph2 [Xylona heveae TC161]KZF26071.1 putative diphthamide biosynthesis protein Dph2 [Xylona heveae TC161]